MADLARLLEPCRAALAEASARVVASGRFVLGPELDAFEAAMAERLGAAHALGVSSGTDALVLALEAYGVGPGDRVLTTPFSFLSSSTALLRVGAVPVFVDIDPKTYALDPAAAAAWRAAHPEVEVKAVLPAHLFGQVADVDGLGAAVGAPVIEDAAQALDARFPDGRAAGTRGVAGTLSFFPTKNLGALGDAGLVVTDDDDLAERVRRRRSHGVGPDGWVETLGHNHRLDEMQAALLRVLLGQVDAWTAKRRDHAARLDAALAAAGLAHLGPARPGGLERHACHHYVLRAPHGAREKVRAALAADGIDTAVYYPRLLPAHPAIGPQSEIAGDLPVARRAAEECFAVPIHPALDRAQIEKVADRLPKALLRWYTDPR